MGHHGVKAADNSGSGPGLQEIEASRFRRKAKPGHARHAGRMRQA